MSLLKRNGPPHAGAVAVRRARATDVESLARLADAIREHAAPVTVGDDVDGGAVSAVEGTYDWRGYLHEEVREAKRRESQRPKAKEEASSAPKPAPSVFYA